MKSLPSKIRSKPSRTRGASLLLAVLLGITFLLTLILGTDPSYAAAQVIIFSIFAAYILTMKTGYTLLNSLVLANLLKIFVISQVVKVFLGQAADIGIASPNETAWAIAAGALGCLLASWLLGVFRNRQRATSKSRAISPWAFIEHSDLEIIGYALAIAGLLSRVAASSLPDAPVFLFYAGNLTYVGVAALILNNQRKSGGKVVFDRVTTAIIIAFAAISVMKGSKQLVVSPFVFVAIIYIYFGRMPKTSTIALGALAFLFTAVVLYPTINYARLISPTNPTAGLAMAMQTAGNLDGWKTLSERSDGLEAKWANRLYFGRPMGMINRFTPNQIADVVNVASYTSIDAKPQVLSAIGQLLPQTFGFERNNNSASSAIESAVRREYNTGENNANYGLIANFYLFGGLVPTFVGMFTICMLIGLIEIAWFSAGRYGFWALPLVPDLLFSIADKNIASFLVTFVHGTTITILLALLISFAVSSLANNRSRGKSTFSGSLT